MKIYNNTNITYINNRSGLKTNKFNKEIFVENKSKPEQNISFSSNPFTKVKNYFQYKSIQNKVDVIAREYYKLEKSNQHILFRNLSMENIEGLQYGIKAFEGLSMKDIQYLCENLHVIAVKRGCTNMCGYCYADAKPQKREMSWEDFKTITDGIAEIRKRLHNMPIFGENNPLAKENPLYRVTELFYDSDCMNLAIKDNKGKIYDFIDMLNEIHNFGRKSCFDTSGWTPQNIKMQERAEKYAKYFSKPENMDKLEAFNISFNVFHSLNVTAKQAFKNGDREKAIRLRDRYTDRIANAIFTFTPLLKYPNFEIMTRCFGHNAKNAKGFDIETMVTFIHDVNNKLANLYEKDFKTEQKYIKKEEDIEKYLTIALNKMGNIDTALNSSGRMKDFMKHFNIIAPMQKHDETTLYFIEDLKKSGRYHKIPAQKLIDTDGKVYHMDYARFFPTEIQLNIQDKQPSPKLANTRDFKITKDIINKKEYIISKNEAIFD